LHLIALSVLVRPGREAEYCDEHICLFVSLCVCAHISGTRRPSFTKIFAPLTWPWLGSHSSGGVLDNGGRPDKKRVRHAVGAGGGACNISFSCLYLVDLFYYLASSMIVKYHVWKWPVVKYKHIKIKPRICILFILCVTWTVNANSSEQNIIVIKEIIMFLAATFL